MAAPVIALIAAVADNGVIGDGEGMPWRLSTDLRRFKALTLGKPVVMGRRTFASIGKPLPGRANIVVTRRSDFAPAGVAVAHDIDAALALALDAARDAGAAEAMVIGGGEIYAQAMARAGRLYITHVHAAPAGTVHFPVIAPDVWRQVSSEEFPSGVADTAATTFAIYERQNPAD